MTKTFEECLQSEGVVSLDLNAADYAEQIAKAVADAVKTTKRHKVLYSAIMDQDVIAKVIELSADNLDFLKVNPEGMTGCISIFSLDAMLDNTVGCVIFENPAKPGLPEMNAVPVISASRHSCAIVVVGLDK